MMSASENPTTEDRYARMCFVIMAYGRRQVCGVEIDFDAVYDDIFKPAIQNVRVQGRRLIPKRADRNPESVLVFHAMYQDLLLARLALADISFNSQNVFTEVGVRIGLVESGTLLFRQPQVPIPFDLGAVLVREYTHQPKEAAKASRRLISKALRYTLKSGQMDSPIYAFARDAIRVLVQRMGSPENPTKLGSALVTAELAAWNGEFKEAADAMRAATALDTDLGYTHLRRGELLLAAGSSVHEARDEILAAVKINPQQLQGKHLLSYLDKGIKPPTTWLGTGLRHSFEELLAGHRLASGKPDASMNGILKPSLDTVNVVIHPYQRDDGRLQSEISIWSNKEATIQAVPDLLSKYGAVVDVGKMEFKENETVLHQFDVVSPMSLSTENTPFKIAKQLKNIGGAGETLSVKVDGGFSPGGGFGGGGVI